MRCLIMVFCVLSQLTFHAGCVFKSVKQGSKNEADVPNSASLMQGSRQLAFWPFSQSRLQENEILNLSSAGPIKISQARVIVDNDAAFDSKIEAIQSARAGETIRMAYYIYSDDESSSYFSRELLKAAQRGVKVRLLVDLWTNMPRIELFDYLQSYSFGNIEVRFYGRPSPLVERDVKFITWPCPETLKVKAYSCSDYKWKQLENDALNDDWYARWFMFSLYYRSHFGLTSAVKYGAFVDPEAWTRKSNSANKEDVVNLLKLIVDAKVKKDPQAQLKLFLALKFKSKELNPVLFELFGHLPLAQKGKSSLSHWEHLTDFLHHKFLLVGEHTLQVGGRNIENSYHMKSNSLTNKYIFLDTDLKIDIQEGGSQLAEAFDALWDFKAMVLSLDSIYKEYPVDFVLNKPAVEWALGRCVPQITKKTFESREKLKQCLESEYIQSLQYRSREERLKLFGEELLNRAIKYETQYKPLKKYEATWKIGEKAFNDSMPAEDLASVLVAYFENLHFDKKLPFEKRERILGNQVGKEARHGRYLHELWRRSLEEVCYSAAEDKKKNPKANDKIVLFHTAYLLFPAGLLRPLAKMMDGTWDCKHVRVVFLTNSFETTDLNIINVFARYQMLAFFQTYSSREKLFGPLTSQRSAQFEYYEIHPSFAQSKFSLHSKVSLFGDNVFIGSANSDVRSYFMDTNNGILLRNAKRLAAGYSDWIRDWLHNERKTVNWTAYYSDARLTPTVLHPFNKDYLNALIVKYKWEDKVSPAIKKWAIQEMNRLSDTIYKATQMILSKDYIELEEEKELGWADQVRLNKQREIEQQFDRLLKLL